MLSYDVPTLYGGTVSCWNEPSTSSALMQDMSNLEILIQFSLEKQSRNFEQFKYERLIKLTRIKIKTHLL